MPLGENVGQKQWGVDNKRYLDSKAKKKDKDGGKISLSEKKEEREQGEKANK